MSKREYKYERDLPKVYPRPRESQPVAPRHLVTPNLMERLNRTLLTVVL